MENSDLKIDLSKQQLDFQLEIERQDSTGMFKKQSKRGSDPAFICLLKKQYKDSYDEMKIYERMISLEKLNIFVQELLKGSDTSKLVHPKIEDKLFMNRYYKITDKKHQIKMNNQNQHQDNLLRRNREPHKLPNIRRRVGEQKRGLRISDNVMWSDNVFISSEEHQQLAQQYGISKKKVLVKGHLFGEYALFSNDPRSATIIVDKEGTELLTIDKRDFEDSINKLRQIMNKRKELILQIFPDSKTLSSGSQLEMLYSFEPIIYRNGDYITETLSQRQEQGREPIGNDDVIYLIEEGEIFIEKEVSLQANPPYQKFTQQNTIHLTTLGPGSLIGDELLTKKLSYYQYTTKIHSTRAVLLQISMKNLRKRFPTEVIRSARKLYKVKAQEREEQYQKQVEQMTREFNDPVRINRMQQEMNRKIVNGNSNLLLPNNNQQKKQQRKQFSSQSPDGSLQNLEKLYTEGSEKQGYHNQTKSMTQLSKKHIYKIQDSKNCYTVSDENLILKAEEKILHKQNVVKTKQQIAEEKKNIQNYLYDFGRGQKQYVEKSINTMKMNDLTMKESPFMPKKDLRLAKMWKQGQRAQDSHILLNNDSYSKIMGQVQYQCRNYYHKNSYGTSNQSILNPSQPAQTKIQSSYNLSNVFPSHVKSKSISTLKK